MAKRKTYRQRVLEFYPHAEYFAGDVFFDTIVNEGNAIYQRRVRTTLAYNVYGPSTEAWKVAWKETLLLVVEKLEN